MTRHTSMNGHSNCCSAAVCSFARVEMILDTVILAVSFVVLLVGLLIPYII